GRRLAGRGLRRAHARDRQRARTVRRIRARASGRAGRKPRRMKLSRDTLLKALAALLLVAFAAWVAQNTEWVDVDEPVRPHGAAEHDPLYAVKQLLHKLGAKVAAPRNFER